MATSAQYVTTPVLEIMQGITADTSRTAPTAANTYLVCQGPATASGSGVGKRITRVTVSATGTTTAGVIRFWISVDTGTTKRLILEKIVAANTPSTSNPVVRFDVPELVGLVLPGTVASAVTSLYATTNNTETFNFLVESGTL
jgi:hypothetical protein